MKPIAFAALSVLLSTSAIAANAPAPAPAPLTNPPIGNTLSANPKPLAFDAGPVGKINVGGVVSGLGFLQTNATAADDDSRLDFSNAQIFVQKNTGLVQFYAQAGGYSIPALGTSYVKADDTTRDFFSLLPVAYVTLAPTDYFSLSVGKLPTLIGAEYTFTFQNANIQRGLLWNQENAINRGIQANFTLDKLALSVSLNDGFYSKRYSWLTGLATYTLNDNNTIAFAAGGNLGGSSRSSLETPLLQNNSEIYNLIYTHKAGAWTLSPYLQYNHVSEDSARGIANSGSTYAGALLATYKVNDKVSVAGRAEYIDGTGDANLTYGAGSNAWSVTVTPTYQQGAFFGRLEGSYVGVGGAAAGSSFDTNGNADSQVRGLLEVGLLF